VIRIVSVDAQDEQVWASLLELRLDARLRVSASMPTRS
jgi:hypothetical protein